MENKPVNVMTPDAAILQQLEGQWQKLAAMIVYKLGAGKPLVLTAADFEAIEREHPGGLTLLVNGHADSIELRLVSLEEAQRILERNKRYERT